jgi:hypothetical protein
MSFVYPSLQRVPDTIAISGTNALSDSAGGPGPAAPASATPMKADSVVETPPDSAHDLADALKHFSSTTEPKGRQHHHAADGADAEPKILHGLKYGRELEAAAKKHGVDPILLAAVAAQEGGGGGIQAHNIDQRNGLGRGPMQIDIGRGQRKLLSLMTPPRALILPRFC